MPIARYAYAVCGSRTHQTIKTLIYTKITDRKWAAQVSHHFTMDFFLLLHHFEKSNGDGDAFDMRVPTEAHM